MASKEHCRGCGQGRTGRVNPTINEPWCRGCLGQRRARRTPDSFRFWTAAKEGVEQGFEAATRALNAVFEPTTKEEG